MNDEAWKHQHVVKPLTRFSSVKVMVYAAPSRALRKTVARPKRNCSRQSLRIPPCLLLSQSLVVLLELERERSLKISTRRGLVMRPKNQPGAVERRHILFWQLLAAIDELRGAADNTDTTPASYHGLCGMRLTLIAASSSCCRASDYHLRLLRNSSSLGWMPDTCTGLGKE